MVRVLITRPREDAEALAEALAVRGVEALVEPLLEIVPLNPGDFDLAGVQAALLTSANGARALAAATGLRDVPVLAVGEATAAAARAAGFAEVAVAGGDVAACLADGNLYRFRLRLTPNGGALERDAKVEPPRDGG